MNRSLTSRCSGRWLHPCHPQVERSTSLRVLPSRLAAQALQAHTLAGFLPNGDLEVTGMFVGDGSGLTTVPAGVHDLGDENTAVGTNALQDNTTGMNNTASGANALKDNTTGDFNTAFGRSALALTTGGDANTGIGHQALNATTGAGNTAVGLDLTRFGGHEVKPLWVVHTPLG